MEPRLSLSESVLANDLCIGCGACLYAEPGKYQMTETVLGFFRAESVGGAGELPRNARALAAETICPFAADTTNEDALSEKLFPAHWSSHSALGRYLACYAGRVHDQEIFGGSSSGGIARWLLSTLLRQGRIDGVATVFDGPADGVNGDLFAYRVSRNPDEVLTASKSAYYPVEMSAVLAEIRRVPGRYAVTGVPCFIKAIRNLCERDPVLHERIVLTVGIICGHLKGRFYAELLAWQLGIPPKDLGRIDFRKKIPGRRANEKGVFAVSRGNPEETAGPDVVQNLFGTNYGQGFFKYKACDFCDDIVAETADVSIGDAWLPEYMDKGTSLVIVRSEAVDRLLAGAADEGHVLLDALDGERAAKSQDAGIRHRRIGLSLRLHDCVLNGEWSPPKRVRPDPRAGDRKYRRVISVRSEIRRESPRRFLEARRLGNLKGFIRDMEPLVRRHREAYSSAWRIGLKRLLAKFGVSPQMLARVRRQVRRRKG